MNKIKYLWYLAIAKSYMLVTDRMGTIDVPYVDPYTLKSVMIIGAQQAALEDMRDKLDEIIKEHQGRINRLSQEEDKQWLIRS